MDLNRLHSEKSLIIFARYEDRIARFTPTSAYSKLSWIMQSTRDRFWDHGSGFSRSWRPVMTRKCCGLGFLSSIVTKQQWAAVSIQCLFSTLPPQLCDANFGWHPVEPFGKIKHPFHQIETMKGYLWGGFTVLPFNIRSVPTTAGHNVDKICYSGMCAMRLHFEAARKVISAF